MCRHDPIAFDASPVLRLAWCKNHRRQLLEGTHRLVSWLDTATFHCVSCMV